MPSQELQKFLSPDAEAIACFLKLQIHQKPIFESIRAF